MQHVAGCNPRLASCRSVVLLCSGRRYRWLAHMHPSCCKLPVKRKRLHYCVAEHHRRWWKVGCVPYCALNDLCAVTLVAAPDHVPAIQTLLTYSSFGNDTPLGLQSGAAAASSTVHVQCVQAVHCIVLLLPQRSSSSSRNVLAYLSVTCSCSLSCTFAYSASAFSLPATAGLLLSTPATHSRDEGQPALTIIRITP